MDNDVLYLIYLFKAQSDTLRTLLMNPKTTRDEFNEYSYSAWAIEKVVSDIESIKSRVDVNMMRQLLLAHVEMYDSFIESEVKNSEMYEYCQSAVVYLYRLTGGYAT